MTFTKTIFLGLALLASSAAWSQGGANPGGPVGTGSMTAYSPPGGSGVPVSEASFQAQCMTNLSSLATQKLQLQLTKDKAVTQQVLAAAAIGEAALGGSCANACAQYAHISHLISWAHVSPGFLSEPEHTQQIAYSHIPQPAMPGQAALDSCLPQTATLNWCPKSGTGVGAGPNRQENPMDKIKVCITVPDAFANMNFSPADLARNCAKPSIVDAADRIKAEQNCVNDSVKAEQKAAADKLAADKAAAVATAQMPVKPLTVSLTPVARKAP